MIQQRLAELRQQSAATANSFAFNFAVWLVALSASLFNLFNYQEYPLFTLESAILLAGLGVLAGLMALLRKLAGPRIGFLFTSLFAAVAIDFNSLDSMSEFYLVWGALACAALLFEGALLKLTLAAFGAVCLFQLTALTTGIGAVQKPANEARVPQAAAGKSPVRPPIIHLVLDSYMGIDGMAVSSPHLKRLAAEQREFYLRQGFQIYPRAYSRHVKTINSLPHLFSYGEAPLATTDRHLQHYAPDELAYFSDLDAAGYRIDAVLPSFVDLCIKQKLSHCRNYERSGLASMRGADMSTIDRAEVIAFHLLRMANLPSKMAERLNYWSNKYLGFGGRPPGYRPNLLPLPAIQELDRIIAGLDKLDYGEVRVAHLLVPHDPYMLDAQCRVLPTSQWFDGHGPGTVLDRERAYGEQVRCLTSRIDKLVQALQRTEAGRDAIVIIHGDHGARINVEDPSANGPAMTDRDVLTAYSTMFAIKVPGQEPATFAQPVSLDELMADFRRRDFAAAPHPTPEPAKVYLVDEKWIPTTMRDLPKFEDSLTNN